MASSGTSNGMNKGANGVKSATNPGKATFAQKMAERKNEEEAAAAQKRAAQPPKAWTSGVNPITQKSNLNGAAKSSSSSANSTSTLSKTLTDRNNWVWNITVGARCTITTSNGDSFTGIFSGLQKVNNSNVQQFAFKMVKNQSQEYVGRGGDHTMQFSVSEIAIIEIAEGQAAPRQPNGATKFRTDVDISGNLAQRERNLQKWEAPVGSIADGALESGNDSHRGWNQFEANERLFGVKTDYDENFYTTPLDRNDPQYSRKEQEAARVAREIESAATTNPHVREERGIVDDSGIDEETKYSGVVRNYEPLQSNQPGRYVPPSRRQPAAVAAEPFVDPAIISSQIARPKSAAKQEKAAEEKPTTEDLNPQAESATSKPETVKADTTPSKDAKVTQEKPIGAPSATANVENDLLDSFKQFSATEKMRIQAHKRDRASQDKVVKLNELKKFSQNFKLCTPVPKDLVPILAKDKAKQEALIEKAQKNAENIKATDRTITSVIDPKTQKPLAFARWENDGPVGDQNKLKGVPIPSGQLPKGPQAARPTPGLSAKLQESHRAHKAMAAGPPPQLPLQNTAGRTPSGVSSPTKTASLRGPLSATSSKFNVKAMEFRPNPSASTFKPSVSLTTTVVGSDRSGSVTRHASPAHAPLKLFTDKKTFSSGSKASLAVSEAKADTETFKFNSGFDLPYRANPTWDTPAQAPNGEPEPATSYKDYFNKHRIIQTPSNSTSPINPAAHQHQLPLYMQNVGHPGAQAHAPQPVPLVVGRQQFAHQAHYDDHHMRPSVSQTGFPAPSPRMQQNGIVYQTGMPPQPQVYGAPIQYVVPGQPQMGGRQYSNGPHPMGSVPQVHLAPMMVQQPSQGGYMPQQVAVPYGAVYAIPAPGYPPAQPPNGYPSPGRGAPMMMHSGSHQGHQPQFIPAGYQPVYPPQPPTHVRGFGSPQPGFAQQPYQQHHYPHQPRRTPSAGYGHPQQMQHVVPQAPQISGAPEEDGK